VDLKSCNDALMKQVEIAEQRDATIKEPEATFQAAKEENKDLCDTNESYLKTLQEHKISEQKQDSQFKA
jgi:hypothetical protein